MAKPKDYTGKKYNKLTAIEFTGRRHITAGLRYSIRIWRFRCDCGREVDALISSVTNGFKTCCGECNRKSAEESLAWAIYHQTYRDGDLKFEDFKSLSQEPCFYCGAPPSNRARRSTRKDVVYLYSGLDRIDQTKPHNLDNVVPCCFKHNSMKKRMSTQQFLNDVMGIVMHQVRQVNMRQPDEKYEALRLSMYQPEM